jgi:hypothetical protein
MFQICALEIGLGKKGPMRVILRMKCLCRRPPESGSWVVLQVEWELARKKGKRLVQGLLSQEFNTECQVRFLLAKRREASWMAV